MIEFDLAITVNRHLSGFISLTTKSKVVDFTTFVHFTCVCVCVSLCFSVHRMPRNRIAGGRGNHAYVGLFTDFSSVPLFSWIFDVLVLVLCFSLRLFCLFLPFKLPKEF